MFFSVLEFELRKAHETIKSLRGSLTKASDIHTRGDEIRQNQTNKDVCYTYMSHDSHVIVT